MKKALCFFVFVISVSCFVFASEKSEAESRAKMEQKQEETQESKTALQKVSSFFQRFKKKRVDADDEARAEKETKLENESRKKEKKALSPESEKSLKKESALPEKKAPEKKPDIELPPLHDSRMIGSYPDLYFESNQTSVELPKEAKKPEVEKVLHTQKGEEIKVFETGLGVMSPEEVEQLRRSSVHKD